MTEKICKNCAKWRSDYKGDSGVCINIPCLTTNLYNNKIWIYSGWFVEDVDVKTKEDFGCIEWKHK